MTRSLLLLLTVAAGCAGPSKPRSTTPAAVATPVPSTPTAAPAATPAAGKIGDGCTADGPFSQGSCGDGLVCGPGPGGYCTTSCGFGKGCAAGTTCSVAVGRGAYGDACMDEKGVLHVVYVFGPDSADRFGDPRNLVEYVHGTGTTGGGRAFTAPVRVSEEGESVPFYFSNPQVVHDARRGRLHVAYPAGGPNAQWSIRLAVSSDGGKSWRRRVVNDDAPCANHMTPRAALDPDTGDLHLIWVENRGGQGRVVYSVCGSGGRDCTPNEAVSAPFAAYTFVRHSSMWLGEYPALVVDAPRRALHAVWTQPVDENGVAVSRIFHARATLRRAVGSPPSRRH